MHTSVKVVVSIFGVVALLLSSTPRQASAKPAQVRRGTLPPQGMKFKGEGIHRTTRFLNPSAVERKTFSAAIHKRLLPKINQHGSKRTIKKIFYLGTSSSSQTYVDTGKRPTGFTRDVRFNVEDSAGKVHTIRLRSRRIAGSSHTGENVALFTSGARGVIPQTKAKSIAESKLKLPGSLSAAGLTTDGGSYVFSGPSKKVLVDIWTGKSQLK